jgi:basic amino acid/polyamine antiporter, APA family
MSDAGHKPTASLSVLDGVALLVGIIIGIGIFKTPALVAANVSSAWGFLALWLLGAAMTFVGALVYAELGSSHPSTGGEYHWLSKGIDERVGLLFAWARLSVIQTGAIAAVAFVFADYAQQLLPLGRYGQAAYAALAIMGFTLINIAGAQPTRSTQHVFTVATVLGVAAVIGAGFLVTAPPTPVVAAPVPGQAAAGLALVFILLTYGGWNEAAYLSAELRDARRNMVRVLLIATTLVAALYLLVNLAMLRGLGLEAMRGSEAVGADLMRAALGEAGAVVFSAFVCVAALSTLNATIFTGARAYHAVGTDVPALRRLGFWNARGGTPTNALVLQGAIALALVGFGAVARDGFQAIVEYTAPVFWLFLLLVGVAAVRLRSDAPASNATFRAPLHPVAPALFCLTCAYLLHASLVYTGWHALVGVAVLLAGLPLIALGSRRDRVAAE